jgi:hypothetical protein
VPQDELAGRELENGKGQRINEEKKIGVGAGGTRIEPETAIQESNSVTKHPKKLL